ncbi:MAG: cysteine--tRNA ligase [Magnetococcales bacterium]|nr:cysteine--tRNA ligase [Magnetococcales bacterium]
MTLCLHNSLGRRKEIFQPLVPGRAGIYVCGITAYDYCHIGHARVMVSFDVIVRHLRALGYQVTYVRNFTDIDDKIIQRAAREGVEIGTLTERFIQAFHEDMRDLGVAPADVEPRATDHLPEMQEMIRALLEKNLAYCSGGDVYYAVDRFSAYGALSGKHLEELDAGARVEVDARKSNPLDFVLWKAAKPGEPAWPSPWGPGRPGWHIECSAMSVKYLGESFDIHGGGRDLIFPHHENEIAQTEGATGRPWVAHWLHNGFVNVVSAEGEREKMSKSLDNFRTIRDLLTAYRGETIRMFLLGSHYRAPLDFSFELLDAARGGLDRLYSALRGAEQALGTLPQPGAIDWTQARGEGWAEPFFAAMDDDFNTPRALAVLFEQAKAVNRLLQETQHPDRSGELRQETARLRALGSLLGLCGEEPEKHFRFAADTGAGGSDAAIEERIAQRAQARANRDFATADRIRAELAAAGITLEDSKSGTTWRREG